MSVLITTSVVALTWAAEATGEHGAAAEEHNPILPAWPEIIIGSIAFLLLLWVLSKFVFPTFERLHRERTEAIEGGMKRAAQTQAKAEELLRSYQESMQQARTEAAHIRTQAQSERAQIIEAAREEAREAANHEVTRARQRLESDLAATRQALLAEVGDLAVDLASRVVGENLAATEATNRTVDRFMAELEQQLAADNGNDHANPLTSAGGQRR